MDFARTSHLPRILFAVTFLCSVASAFGQVPVFRFNDAASQVRLEADVFADDCFAAPEQGDLLIQNVIGLFQYSGGLSQWGAGGTRVVHDGAVTSSANPLVRLDGSDTPVIQIAWKAWPLNSASASPTSPCYTAIALADTQATFSLTLDDLVTGAAYDVHYRWTFEARADEEHDTAAEDDPTFGSIDLELDIDLFGPGPVFGAVVDNAAATPSPALDMDEGQNVIQFVALAASIPITVNMDAFAAQTMVYPTLDDAARCFMRGTLDIWVIPQGAPQVPQPLIQSNVIISEVVSGAVGNSNPRYTELTNCGEQAAQFGPGDELLVFADGAAIPTAIVDLSGVFLNPGESFVIASSQFGGDLAFPAIYGFAADLYDAGLFGDGNDMYALMSAGSFHDVYGVLGVDPLPPLPGAPWAYADSHAHRKPNRFPNKGFFDSDNWIVAPLGSLLGANDGASAALALAQTTPGAHACNNIPVVLPGDMNCDGVVNMADVDPFALALVNPAAYALAFPGCDILAGDMNGDGLLNGTDVALFIAAI